MIFISAQNDELYFKWQLELQLFNFKKLGIPSENIHVLIGYNPSKGLNPVFDSFFEDFKDYASFFVYPDNRINPVYSPSVRPHILKKHFLKCSELNERVLFYHDCDIIFRELPNFNNFTKDDNWYVSDTRSYIGVEYIKTKGDTVFADMCNIIGIEQDLVLKNDLGAGGAQYILKGLNYQFWNKVEEDSEKLFSHLTENKNRYSQSYANRTGNPAETYHEIQRWCADMWAVLWNGFLLNYNVRIEPELDFCWPDDPLDRWRNTKIFHNAGVDEKKAKKYFYKGDFSDIDPFNTDFSYVDKTSCSIKYVELIHDYMQAKPNNF